MNREYKKNGYFIVRNFISLELTNYLRFFFIKARDNFATKQSKQASGADDLGRGNPFELLLDYKCAFVEEKMGLELYPTYSYGRIYYNGSILPRHKDRQSCENSVTINLGGKYKLPWPIWIQDARGKSKECVLEEGDALLYRGCERTHWREPWKCKDSEWQAQIFLHYVEKVGQYSGFKYDNRPFLNY